MADVPDHPTALPPLDAMLLVIRRFLESDIVPGLQGPEAFGMRMVLRQLEIAAREIELAPAFLHAEHERLQILLDRHGELNALRKSLAALIRSRQFPGDQAALFAHLESCLQDDLRINNPKWLMS